MDSDRIEFPILLYNLKTLTFDYFENADDMNINMSVLKRLLKLNVKKGVISNDMKLFNVKDYQTHEGVGRLAGYHFEGPFLERRVRFSLVLQKKGEADRGLIFKIFSRFVQDAEDFENLSFSMDENKTKSSLKDYYSEFTSWIDRN